MRNRYTFPVASAFTADLNRRPGYRSMFGGPQVFFDDPADGGVGGSGGSGEAGGQGAGGGVGAGAGDGGEKPIVFEAGKDPLVQFPGMTKPVKWSEYQKGYVPRTQHEPVMNLLTQLGKAMAGRKPGQPQGQGHGGGQPQRRQSDRQPDPLAQLEANELPSGKDIAGLLRAMDGTRLQPIANIVKALQNEVKELKTHVGGLRGKEADQQFGSRINATIQALKLPQLADAKANSQLEEVARDLYYSHDDVSQQHFDANPAVFQEQLKARIDGLRLLVRALDKADLDAANKLKRDAIFTRRGTGGSVNGKPQPRLTNKALAEVLFASQPAT